MAQFTTGGRLKSIFSGDGLSIGFESKDPFHHHPRGGKFVGAFSGGRGGRGSLRSIHSSSLHKRKLSFTVRTATSSSAMDHSDGIFDEIMEEAGSEFDIDDLSGFRGLVLDISYRPVNVVCWKRAICLEFMDKADVLEYYDQTVKSPSGSFYIPAVLRVPHLLQIVKRRKLTRTLSRKNIFHRDNYTCQYCSAVDNLTIDHVLPIARGGKWTWENLVIYANGLKHNRPKLVIRKEIKLLKLVSYFWSLETVAACSRCNSKKGQKTLEEANMKLMKVPKAMKDYDILAIPLTNHAIKMLKMRKGLPEEWQEYLSKPFAAP